MQSTRFIGLPLAIIIILFPFTNQIYAADDSYSYAETIYGQTQAANSDEQLIYNPREDNGFYVGIDAGITLSNLNNNRLLTEINPVDGYNYTYDFISNDKYNPNVLLGLRGGYELYLTDNFFLDLGVSFCGFDYRIGRISADGKIVMETSGIVNNFNYSYRITSLQFMFETRLKYRIKRFLPFLILGAGPGWNSAENFATKSGSGTRGFISYSPNRKTNFAYELGVGIDYQLSENSYKDYIGISYKYVNLGKMDFNFPDTSFTMDKLGTGTIVTHNVMVQYTHHF